MNEEALILVVEDDDNDAFLLQDAFHRAGILNPIKILVNEAQAVDYLLGNGQYGNREHFPLPGIIFADLHTPLAGGLEFLRWLKSQPYFSEIPVIAMTGSGDNAENDEAFRAGANLAFYKPLEHDKLVEEVQLICEHVLVT